MRKRKCRSCRIWYTPEKDTQAVCGRIECALAHGRAERKKAADEAHRARKKALKDNDRGFQMKKAQEAFNRYIRLRDSNLPCVSCGRWHNGQWHASHYRPVGNNGALRFNEINCHRACSVCNNHHSGNLIPYREELIRRIGESLVEWLERDHGPNQLTIEEIRATRKYYENACKEILAAPGEIEPF